MEWHPAEELEIMGSESYILGRNLLVLFGALASIYAKPNAAQLESWMFDILENRFVCSCAKFGFAFP